MAGRPSRSRTLTAYRVGNTTLKLIAAPAARTWMSATDQRFAYRCLPLLIANQSGWLILNNVGFTAIWTGDNAVDALSVAYDSAEVPPSAGTYFGYGIITWNIPYLFRTPPGFNLLARGPANTPKDAVYPLEGTVEADWTSATFTMNWKVTRPNTPVRFEADEPICMVVPQRRGELEGLTTEIRQLEQSPDIQDLHRKWASSRAQFLKDLGTQGPAAEGARAAGWQRDYFQGRHANGVEADQGHQTRLRLHEFEVKS